ncbi:MAG: dienelactone hydrolase family protein [Pseudomonadota bacterium]
MGVVTSVLDYEIGGQVYEGYLARPDSSDAPIVLVAHAWGGQGDFERGKADWLANEGYAGFAIDVYGKGKRGETTEECQALMSPLAENRAELQARLNGSLDFARAQPGVDGTKAAATGFCFGGLSVLDMARAGMDVAGVVSFHGLLGAAPNISEPKISAKVLALHGWDDPMATPEDVIAFSKEMSAAKADWQLHGYGGVMHAFTNPGADNPDFGTVYHAGADRRSFAAAKDFLSELF